MNLMPELRKCPVTGRWVIIARERALRPGNIISPTKTKKEWDPPETCPFCANKDPVVFRYPTDPKRPWAVEVCPSGTPSLKPTAASKRWREGIYFVMSDHGVHEVVVETPDHIANMADLSVEHIRMVFETYRLRFLEYEKDEALQYIIAYKNYGVAAGSRPIGHARSQIIASTVNPIRVKEKLFVAKKHFDLHDRCLYCDLLRQEWERQERIVAKTQHFTAFVPYAPRFPFEMWVLPHHHHCDFMIGVEGVMDDLARLMKDLLSRLKYGLDDPAYNYMIQTAPFHREKRWDRWLTIEDDYHWHIEIIPRLVRFAGFEKGSGFYINPIPPEEAAAYLREVVFDGAVAA